MSVAHGIAPGGGAEATPPPPEGRGGSRTAYILLALPLLWLFVFFVFPLFSLIGTSLYDPAGSLETGYAMTGEVGNYLTVLSDYREHLIRSLVYAGIATISCIVLAYPLAYAIAFKAGRWRNLMLVAVIAPFFTSFLIRTLSWQLLLADHAWITETLRFLQILDADGRRSRW